MKILPPEQAFLALAGEDAVSYQQAKAVIVPFGLEASVSYGRGTQKGPMAMIQASREVELFDDAVWCEPFRSIGIVTLEEPEIAPGTDQALAQLEKIVETIQQDGKFPLVFGGEHSITAGCIRPFARTCNNLAILHIDAHADLRDGYEGTHYSHASALRRCLDDRNVADNGRHIQLVSCGIRNISAEEIPFFEANRHRIHIYWARDKAHWDLDHIISHLRGRPVYLTFDLDGFDSSLMPATGTPEPGGLFWDDAMELIARAAGACHIVGADINELSPIKGLHACDFLAAKLAYKILTAALLD